jgi:hypothetical protein
MKRTIKKIFYILLVILLVITYIFFKRAEEEYASVTTFDECVSAGYQVLTTYPEQCKMPGKTFTNTKQIEEDTQIIATTTPSQNNTSPKNTSYTIEGELIELTNGESVIEQDASSSEKETSKYFGKELRVDLNEDGTDDSAFILTKNGGGSGTFYYLVVALNKNNGFVGINGILLGDRIEPVSNEFKNGEIVITYLDRLPSEPMVKKPTNKAVKHFKIMNETLVEINE